MNLNVKDYAEYEANVGVFAALEKAGIYYDSNVCEILYEHIYDELVDIIFSMSARNLRRLTHSSLAGGDRTKLTDIICNYADVYSENLIGKKITRVLLLRWIITDMEAEFCTLCGQVEMYHPDHK